MKTLKIGNTTYFLKAFRGMTFEDFVIQGHACGMDPKMVYDRLQKELSSESEEVKPENTKGDVSKAVRKGKRNK